MMSATETETAPSEVPSVDILADPMSFFPLPDPSASTFTVEQVWPRVGQTSQPTSPLPSQATGGQPAWMKAMSDRTKS